MVDATKAAEGEFLNAACIKNIEQESERTATIRTEGEYKETEFNGKKSLRLHVDVELFDMRLKIYSPNKDSATNLMNKWGRDTKLWLGKKIKFNLTAINGKDVVIAIPAE